MDSPNHFEMKTARYVWLLLPAVGAALVVSWRDVSRLPRTVEVSAVSQVTVLSGAFLGDVEHGPNWSSFVRREVRTTTPASPIRARFRLAGVFIGHDSGREQKRAVLDDAQSSGQRIVSEMEILSGEVLVRQIGNDFVVLSQAGSEEKLTMGFGVAGAGTQDVTSGAYSGSTPAAADQAAETGVNAYGGRQVSENRWQFDRRKLMEYYGRLRDEPERLVKVFDSLKPVYTADRRIGGYRLHAEGEREFFAAAGLREGDVIRSVNSLKMTSRRRAETLIREFVENRVTAFVFEVERNGKLETQIYSVP